MSIGRCLLKTLVSEVELSESRSYSAATLNGGSSVISETFNIQYAQFLQPADANLPADATRIAGGHVLYWVARYTITALAPVLVVSIEGNTAQGGALFSFSPGVGDTADATLAAAVMLSRRVESIGALWEARIRISNTAGAGNIAAVDFAVCVRTR